MSEQQRHEERVALIHYWLVNMRGGEKVLEALCRMYPQAHIYTHVVRPAGLSPLLRQFWDQGRIHTTFIQKLPGSCRHYQKYLPLMPLALEQLDLSNYDLVISSESGPAKGVITRADCPHVCYCHSPMRYLWDFQSQYLAAASRWMRPIMRYFFHHLRLWDAVNAQRVDHFVGNAATVARRIRKHWRREAQVVYPPVDVHSVALSKDREDFYLVLGQLVDYKKVHLAVEACTRMQRPLVVAGDGACRTALEALAGPTVSFVGRVEQTEATRLYSRCKALIFPGEEDFGMVPVEAMATGAPVLAYGRGGATETVQNAVTGLFFAEQSVDALCATLQEFESRAGGFDPATIRQHALQFDEARFVEGMRQAVLTAKAVVAQ